MNDKSPLFSPITVGNIAPSHRIVMAPMTRRRAADNNVPSAIMIEYYKQRASVPGTLLISEATAISPRAAAPPNTPGLWTQEQVDAWKPITTMVHRQGSFIYAQLWMCGRAVHGASVAAGVEVVSSSDIPESPSAPTPRPLGNEEVQMCIREFAAASQLAILAGFDGVELHGANGYLLDQFTQDVSNKRTDEWGGSIVNRSRFPVAVAAAVVDAIGPSRVGYRVSPWSRHHGMGMVSPRDQFLDLVGQLKRLGLAYLHIIESRVQGPMDVTPDASESIDFLADAWGSTSPIIFAGGYDAYTSRQRVREQSLKGRESLIAFGRTFVSNPDLPLRVDQLLPVSAYHRDLFYKVGSHEGYVDYKLWYEEQLSLGDIKPEHVWPAGIASAILR